MAILDDYSRKYAEELASFKDDATHNFLSKHKLTPEDVGGQGRVSKSGYVLDATQDQSIADETVWTLTLYKVVDSAQWKIRSTFSQTIEKVGSSQPLKPKTELSQQDTPKTVSQERRGKNA